MRRYAIAVATVLCVATSVWANGALPPYMQGRMQPSFVHTESSSRVDPLRQPGDEIAITRRYPVFPRESPNPYGFLDSTRTFIWWFVESYGGALLRDYGEPVDVDTVALDPEDVFRLKDTLRSPWWFLETGRYAPLPLPPARRQRSKPEKSTTAILYDPLCFHLIERDPTIRLYARPGFQLGWVRSDPFAAEPEYLAVGNDDPFPAYFAVLAAPVQPVARTDRWDRAGQVALGVGAALLLSVIGLQLARRRRA